MLRCFDNGRMAAPFRSEAVVTGVERRFVMRAQYLVHRLLHDPIDHVRYAKTSLPAARLRYPHAADISWPVAPIEQLAMQHRQDSAEVSSHLVDALSIWTWGALVRRHLLERSPQIPFARYFLHRHRRRDASFRVSRLRHRVRRRPG